MLEVHAPHEVVHILRSFFIQIATICVGLLIAIAELVFPDEIHDFLRHETWLRAYKVTVDFLDQKLAR